MRRALIIGPGGLRGAYGGGVAATLGRELGQDYFATVYGCSAGAYTASYLLSNQPELIERIWRECVYEDKLIKTNGLWTHRQPILDLYYLNNVLKSKKYHLDIPTLLNSPTNYVIVSTNRSTGVAKYFSPLTEAEFFLQVRASAAVPLLHPKVCLGGECYVDGGLSDPFPIKKALDDGHDEIIVISNRTRMEMGALAKFCLKQYSSYRKQPILTGVLEKLQQARVLIKNKPKPIFLISPTQKLPHRWQFDSSKENLNLLVEAGIRDAKEFLVRMK